jgi:hypothetical protein
MTMANVYRRWYPLSFCHPPPHVQARLHARADFCARSPCSRCYPSYGPSYPMAAYNSWLRGTNYVGWRRVQARWHRYIQPVYSMRVRTLQFSEVSFRTKFRSTNYYKAICMITAAVAHPGHTVSMCASHAVFLLLFFLNSSLLQDFNNYTLDHYPNTPIRVDSNPSCPTTCPLAGTYLIKTSTELPGQCVTMTSNADGAPVQIRVGSPYS